MEEVKELRIKLMKSIKTNLSLVKKIKSGILNHKIEDKREDIDSYKTNLIDQLILPNNDNYEEKNKQRYRYVIENDIKDIEYNYLNTTAKKKSKDDYSDKWDDEPEEEDDVVVVVENDKKEKVKNNDEKDKEKTVKFDEKDRARNKNESKKNPKFDNIQKNVPETSKPSKSNNKNDNIEEDFYKRLEGKIESLNARIDKLAEDKSNTVRKLDKLKPIEKKNITLMSNKSHSGKNKTIQDNDEDEDFEEEDLVDNNKKLLKMLFKQKENDDIDLQIYNLSEDIYRNLLIK